MFIAFLLSLGGCGGGGGGGTSQDIPPTGTNVKLSGTVQADPSDPSATGQNSGATVYIIGQQDNATTTDADGNFELTVGTKISGAILSAPGKGDWTARAVTETYGLVVRSASESHGRKVEVQYTEGQINKVSTIYINKVGSISGKALLQGAPANGHAGITVYIPGTSFIAMTNTDGSYTISNVPSGTYDLVRAEKLGETYGFAITANVTVDSNQNTLLNDMVLPLSTGPSGNVLINQGAAFSTSQTVDLSFSPSDNTVLMAVSQSDSFSGAEWQPVVGSMPYLFSGDFSAGGEATVYVKYAEASGLTSPGHASASIYIDTNPRAALTVPAPSDVVANTKPTLGWIYAAPMPNPRYRVQVASDVGFNTVIEEATELIETQFILTNALANSSTYYWRVAVLDGTSTQWSWSEVRAFTVNLGAVALNSPISGTTIANTIPTFSWEANANAASYRLTLSTNSDLSAGIDYTVDAPATSFTPPGLLVNAGEDVTFYWAVTPIDEFDVAGTPSGIWSLRVDAQAPAVASSSPTANAVEVEPSAVVTATFTEPVSCASINAATVTLTAGPLVGGAVSCSGNTANFTPGNDLALLTQYTATINAGVQDLVGNATAASHSWTFTVRDGAWGTAELRELNSGTAGAPQVATDANGNAIAVWQQSNGSRNDIWASRYTPAAGWSTPVLIETENGGSAYFPQIAMDPQGNALVVWYQYTVNGPTDIWANRYTAGIGWGTAATIDTISTNAFSPQVAMDPNGNAMAVWYQHDGARNNIWASRYTPATGWGSVQMIETTNLGGASGPHVAMDKNGNAIAVWLQHDGTIAANGSLRNDIWANRYVAGTGWGTAVKIESSANSGYEPKVAMDASGNAIAVWTQEDSPSHIWANRYKAPGRFATTVGTGWGSAQRIDNGSVNAFNPSVAFDSSGKAIAVWRQNVDIWANDFSGLWGTAYALDTESTTAGKPTIAFDAHDNAMAVWPQPDGANTNIWARRLTSAGWGTAMPIGDSTATSADFVQVTFDPSGRATAVWQHSGSIWANRFE